MLRLVVSLYLCVCGQVSPDSLPRQHKTNVTVITRVILKLETFVYMHAHAHTHTPHNQKLVSCYSVSRTDEIEGAKVVIMNYSV